ncbi:uncharacterized protein LOC128211451 [Mya arenaria]|uniref:uncharacterized protein LOC128211451 n=1 Tax=Mya arenaria TaxID=6604 RepID=UPI0022DF2CA9|nr:uncharacterized protein LOC128211451 [Mya arenaria]
MADGVDMGERTLENLANRLLQLDSAIEKNEHFTEAQARQFIEAKKNKATVTKTRSDMKKVNDWLNDDGETRQIKDIPPKELDILLSRFLLSVKKTKLSAEANGPAATNFEPSTLRGILSSVKRHLSENEYEGDVMGGKEFKLTRDTLKAKCVDLKEKGLGNKKQRADPFTSSEIQQLYEKELLGAASPISLTNTIWLNNTMHLGLRGRQEHLTMLWGDLELSKTSDGVSYLAFTEKPTKTRNGVAGDHRQYVPKLFEQPGDPNCPVRLYQIYKEKRPPQMSAPETRFYVALNPNFGKGTESNDLWFINQNLGKINWDNWPKP